MVVGASLSEPHTSGTVLRNPPVYVYILSQYTQYIYILSATPLTVAKTILHWSEYEGIEPTNKYICQSIRLEGGTTLSPILFTLFTCDLLDAGLQWCYVSIT